MCCRRCPCAAVGATAIEAAATANYAAGVEVGKAGVATVTADELRAVVRQHTLEDSGGRPDLYAVPLDRLLCVGFGDCIDVAPDVFALADGGIVTFNAQADADDRERLVRACDACPVDALSVFDEHGTQLV